MPDVEHILHLKWERPGDAGGAEGVIVVLLVPVFDAVRFRDTSGDVSPLLDGRANSEPGPLPLPGFFEPLGPGCSTIRLNRSFWVERGVNLHEMP